MDEPIIIVGAGPTGLTLALSLGLANIPVVVLEAEPALTLDLRAGSYHPPTIEMLTALGIGDQMHKQGIVVPSWQIRDRVDGIVAEFDLSLIADETRYPYRLHLEQHRLTPMLLERIEAAAPSVRVLFSKPVTTVEQGDNGVSVTAGEQQFRGRYVIGCDGSKSIVRKTMEVAFEGFTWEARYLATSTSYDLGEIGFTGAGYIADPEAWAAVFKVPDEAPPGIWRVVFPIEPDEDEKVAMRPENLQLRLFHLLQNAKPRPPQGQFPLHYTSIYRVHQRVADRFAKGRLIIAGDAAHLNNPLGGLGLNGGIHDAVNLAEKLIAITNGSSEAGLLLDRYDRQRRPINIKAVQAMSIRNKRLLEERDPDVRRQNLEEQRTIAADPVRAKAYLMETSMINSVREAAMIA